MKFTLQVKLAVRQEAVCSYLLVNVSVSDLEESAGDGAHETDPGAKSHPAGP